jgi:hypothetical protein
MRTNLKRDILAAFTEVEAAVAAARAKAALTMGYRAPGEPRQECSVCRKTGHNARAHAE